MHTLQENDLLPIRPDTAHAVQRGNGPQALNVLQQGCGDGNRWAFETLYRVTLARLFGIYSYP
jgi:RNA polymerase sigma-70 factor (ECF subfamily)